MRKWTLFAAAFVALFGAGAGASGQEVIAQEDASQSLVTEDSAMDDAATATFDDCGAAPGAWFFDAEATFFRYHRADGVTVTPIDGEFGFDAAPRLTLGYVDNSGFGARVRYWDYNHTTGLFLPGDYGVDTYNIDFELFQVLCLESCTTVEFSAGLRYNDFVEISPFLFGDANMFAGIGGMFAIEVHRDITAGFGVYGRLREAILMSDENHTVDTHVDTVRPVTEIAFGIDYSQCNWKVHVGVEWQNWGNYVPAQFAVGGLQPVDIGFGGFVAGATYVF